MLHRWSWIFKVCDVTQCYIMLHRCYISPGVCDIEKAFKFLRFLQCYIDGRGFSKFAMLHNVTQCYIHVSTLDPGFSYIFWIRKKVTSLARSLAFSCFNFTFVKTVVFQVSNFNILNESNKKLVHVFDCFALGERGLAFASRRMSLYAGSPTLPEAASVQVDGYV